MSEILQVQDVLQIDLQSNSLELSYEFKDALSKSKDVVIVTFLGYSRSGKSTRLNQLITKEPQSQKPFEAHSCDAPVTKNFQFYGPIKFSDLELRFKPADPEIYPNFKLNISNDRNPDIFLIDCEGTNNIHGVSLHLKPGMLAISQISSVIVQVHPNAIGLNEINEVKFFFGASKSFEGFGFKLDYGTVIMQRDLGPNRDEKPKYPLEFFEEKRQEVDKANKSKLLDFLKIEGKDVFLEENFQSLCQPPLQGKHPDCIELYWNSIRDFLIFVKNICNNSHIMDGNDISFSLSKILKFFSEGNLGEFDWKDLLGTIFEPKFKEAKEQSKEKIQIEIDNIINELTPKENFEWEDTFNQKKLDLLKIFENEANKIYKNICDIFKNLGDKYKKEIEDEIKKTFEKKISKWTKEKIQEANSNFKKAKKNSEKEIEKEINKRIKNQSFKEKITSDEIFDEKLIKDLKDKFEKNANFIQPNIVVNFSQKFQEFKSEIDIFVDQKIKSLFKDWKKENISNAEIVFEKALIDSEKEIEKEIEEKIQEILTKEPFQDNFELTKFFDQTFKDSLKKKFEDNANSDDDHQLPNFPSLKKKYEKIIDSFIDEKEKIKFDELKEKNISSALEIFNRAEISSKEKIEKEISKIIEKEILKEKFDFENDIYGPKKDLLEKIFEETANSFQENVFTNYKKTVKTYNDSINKFIKDKLEERFQLWFQESISKVKEIFEKSMLECQAIIENEIQSCIYSIQIIESDNNIPPNANSTVDLISISESQINLDSLCTQIKGKNEQKWVTKLENQFTLEVPFEILNFKDTIEKYKAKIKNFIETKIKEILSSWENNLNEIKLYIQTAKNASINFIYDDFQKNCSNQPSGEKITINPKDYIDSYFNEFISIANSQLNNIFKLFSFNNYPFKQQIKKKIEDSITEIKENLEKSHKTEFNSKMSILLPHIQEKYTKKILKYLEKQKSLTEIESKQNQENSKDTKNLPDTLKNSIQTMVNHQIQKLDKDAKDNFPSLTQTFLNDRLLESDVKYVNLNNLAKQSFDKIDKLITQFRPQMKTFFDKKFEQLFPENNPSIEEEFCNIQKQLVQQFETENLTEIQEKYKQFPFFETQTKNEIQNYLQGLYDTFTTSSYANVKQIYQKFKDQITDFNNKRCDFLNETCGDSFEKEKNLSFLKFSHESKTFIDQFKVEVEKINKDLTSKTCYQHYNDLLKEFLSENFISITQLQNERLTLIMSEKEKQRLTNAEIAEKQRLIKAEIEIKQRLTDAEIAGKGKQCNII